MYSRPADRAGALAGFALAALLLAPSLFGRSVFVPADIWMRAVPWAFAKPPGAARFPSNAFLSDQAILYAPQLRIVYESLREGAFPLWNPRFRCGEPLLATAVSSPLAPTQWPVLLLPWPHGFAWSALLRFGLMWMGAFLWARSLGLGRGLALGLAVCFSFAPAFLFHFQQPHAVVGVWLPWMLFAIERLARATPLGGRALVRGALPIALVELAALAATHAQAAFNFGFASALYLMLRLPVRPWRSALLARAAGAGALLLGLLAGAPLVVPFLELLRESATVAERTAMGRDWLPSPEVVRTLWDPFALGSAKLGSVWRGALNFEEEQQYLGILPWVFLAGGALGLARGARRDPGPALALLGLVLVCGSLAYGWPPLHGWLASLPPFSLNRNPRFKLFVEAGVLGLAFLAARDWRGSLAGRGPEWAPTALAALAAAGATLVFVLGAGGRFGARPTLALAAAFALWMAGSMARSARDRRLAGVLVPLMLLADLAPLYAGYHSQPPRGWADLERAKAQLPEALRAEASPRLAAQDFAPPNLLALLGAVDVVAYSLPLSERVDLFQRRVLGIAEPDRLTRADLERPDVVAALQGSCADWLWTNAAGAQQAEGLEPVHERRGLRLYRLARAAPFAAWHPRPEVRGAAGLEPALAQLVAARGRFPEAIVVEAGADAAPALAPRPGERAEARYASPQRIEATLPEAAGGADGWLVVRASFDRGWRAENEAGAALRVVPAQLRFLGVEVPAGTRRVVLRYAPPHFAASCASAGAALALGLAAFLWSRGRA